MQSFPWDSLVVEMGEDGFPVYDRAYAASDLREVYATFFSNGIFINSDEAMKVTAGNGFVLTVGYGKCNIRGTIGYIKDERELLTMEAPDSLPRIDTVVLRWNANLSARSIEPFIVKGTPSANPSRPSLRRTGTVYELGIADILVKPGVTGITNSGVVDTRLESSRCGVVTPFVEINTTSFFNRMDAALNEAIRKHEAQATIQMMKLNDEIDRVIFLADKITGGTPEGCGCYEELQLVKNLLYQLINSQEDPQYFVIGKTLYPPTERFTLEDSTITFTNASVEDGVLTLS